MSKATAYLCCTLVLLATTVNAETATIGDERIVGRHLEHAEIAADEVSFEAVAAHGRALFVGRYTVLDGAGRPAATQAIVPTGRDPQAAPAFQRTGGPDANACGSCHRDPEPGGAGDFAANAFVAEGFSDASFDSLDPQLSNERGTPALHGSGLIELLAREMTLELHGIRARAARRARSEGVAVTASLSTKGVEFGHVVVAPDGYVDDSGVEGVDSDLVVRPFGQKGVFASVREFTLGALNAHHGMQAQERFGERWTGTRDFDRDGVEDELTAGDVTALTLFQVTLPMPEQQLPDIAVLREAVARGQQLFREIGCGSCHRDSLALESAVFSEPGPYNPAGALRPDGKHEAVVLDLAVMAGTAGLQRDAQGRWLVPLFSDLKRHRVADAQKQHYANEILSQRFVARDEFLTARLWGVGSTAPYGHRGDITTLDEATRHHGGEATAARVRYEELEELDRRRIIEFLRSLRI